MKVENLAGLLADTTADYSVVSSAAGTAVYSVLTKVFLKEPYLVDKSAVMLVDV